MLDALNIVVNMELHFFKWMPRDTSQGNTVKTTKPLKLLLFLHGMGGTGHIWRPIAAALEDDFLCVAPDQRGHGLSRPIPASEENLFHSEDYANDVFTLIQKLNDEYAPSQIFLIGHSMGVRTALATAKLMITDSALAALLKGVVAVDIGLQSKWGGGIGEPLASFIRALPESFPDRITMRNYLFAHCPDPAIAQYLAAVAKNSGAQKEIWIFPFDHESLVQTILQADESPIEEWVQQICSAGIPLLALRGANSKVWLKEDYEKSRITLANPLLTFEEWPNCGHGLPFEQRARFIERVREFVGATL